jgi:hypothetical protein
VPVQKPMVLASLKKEPALVWQQEQQQQQKGE